MREEFRVREKGGYGKELSKPGKNKEKEERPQNWKGRLWWERMRDRSKKNHYRHN